MCRCSKPPSVTTWTPAETEAGRRKSDYFQHFSEPFWNTNPPDFINSSNRKFETTLKFLMMQQLLHSCSISGEIWSAASGLVCVGGFCWRTWVWRWRGFLFATASPLLHLSGDFELLFICFSCMCFGILMLLFPWHQTKTCLTIHVDMWIFHFSVGLSHPADKWRDLLLFCLTCLLDSFWWDHLFSKEPLFICSFPLCYSSKPSDVMFLYWLKISFGGFI